MSPPAPATTSESASFPPTRAAALERIAAIDPRAYARTRNAIGGAVSRLSPYITHGIVTLPEVLAAVAATHPIDPGHKFVYELGWREYFRHVWRHRGDGILRSLHEGVLPDDAYSREVPADVREARTGVPAIDVAVRALYRDGWLHNHARMWLASYLVHLRKVHWRAGADWMIAHLLDGDLASNHLSWQWVAGTASRKPYLFNAANVAKYAPAEWHSPGTSIDTSYETLDAIARDASAVVADRAAVDGLDEPGIACAPCANGSPGAVAGSAAAIDAAPIRGRDVWIVTPWALRAPPADLPEDVLVLGLAFAEFHRDWPWSAGRWRFVEGGMRAICDTSWHADLHTARDALADARSVRSVADPHVDALLHQIAACRAAPRIFAEPARACGSFSQWWKRVARAAAGRPLV